MTRFGLFAGNFGVWWSQTRQNEWAVLPTEIQISRPREEMLCQQPGESVSLVTSKSFAGIEHRWRWRIEGVFGGEEEVCVAGVGGTGVVRGRSTRKGRQSQIPEFETVRLLSVARQRNLGTT